MLQSPLYNDHQSSGATFADFAGWSMPVHYGDVAGEYQTVQEGAGIIDLSHRGKIRMTGADRQTFLHRIITNEISALKPGDGTYACMLTPQGKIISDMTVYVREDDLLFDTEPGMAAPLMEILDRYALMDDVAMEDVTAEFALIGICGPEATGVLGNLLGVFDEPESLHHITVSYQGHAITIVRSHRMSVPSYDLYIPMDQAGVIWAALLEQGAQRVGLEALETLRIEAGIPRYGAELDDRIIPNEAVKERAVSFNKGCYIGQEPVVMMEHRGRPNRILTGLKIDGDTVPEKDAILQKDGQDAGWITSAVQGQAVDSVIALGFVRRKYMNVGDRLTLEANGATAEAEIVSLPFYET